MHAVCAVQSQILSISYIVLTLPSTVTKLSNKTLIFHDFQGPTINFYDFPGRENEMHKFHDFPGFPWHVQTPPHGMKIPGGWSKAKVPLVGKNPLPISLLNYYSLKINFVPCCCQVWKQQTAEGSVSSSDNTNKDLAVLISQNHPGITIIMPKVNIANKVLRLIKRTCSNYCNQTQCTAQTTFI